MKTKMMLAATAAMLATTPTIAGATSTAAISGWTGATRSFDVSYTSVQTIGWTFKPTVQLTVTSLGLFDYQGDGLDVAHTIGIWNAQGSLLATTTLAAWTGATLTDGFRYTGISGLTLAAGETFTIGATMSVPSTDYYYFGPTAVAADARVGFIGGVRSDETYPPTPGVLTLPTLGQNGGRFGPNFLFDAGPIAAIPEPSSWALMLLGFCAVGGAMRRRRVMTRLSFAAG